MGFSIWGKRYTKDQILRNSASVIPPRINEISLQAAKAAADQLAAHHEGEQQAGISDL